MNHLEDPEITRFSRFSEPWFQTVVFGKVPGIPGKARHQNCGKAWYFGNHFDSQLVAVGQLGVAKMSLLNCHDFGEKSEDPSILLVKIGSRKPERTP